MATVRLTLVLVNCYLFFVPSTTEGVRTEQGAVPSCDVRWLAVPLSDNNRSEVFYFINDFPGSLSVYDDLPPGGAPTAVLEIKGESAQTAHVQWRKERRESGAVQLHVYRSAPYTNLTGQEVLQPASAAKDNTIIVTVVIVVAVFVLSSIFAFIYLQEKRRSCTWHKKKRDVGSSLSKTLPSGTSSFNSLRDSPRRRGLLRRKSHLDGRIADNDTDKNDTDSETEHSPPVSDSEDDDTEKNGDGIKVVFNSSSETLPPSILKKTPGRRDNYAGAPNGCPQGSGISRTFVTSGELDIPSYSDDVSTNSGYTTVEGKCLSDEKIPDAVDVAVDVKPHDFKLSSDVTEDFQNFTRAVKTQRVTFLTSTPLPNASCNGLKTGKVRDDLARVRETENKVVCTEGDRDSGTEADDEGRWNSKSKGRRGPPLGKKMLFIAVCVCLLVCLHSLTTCPVTVSLHLHIPNGFLAPGSRFILHSESDVIYPPWLRQAPVQVYRYVNSSDDRELSRDFCAEHVPSEKCEHTCDPDTGGCSCMEGYQNDLQYPQLCVRNTWTGHDRWWPYGSIGKAFDARTSQQSVNRVFRYTRGDTMDKVVRVVKPDQLTVHASNRCLPPVVNTAGDVASLRKNLLDALSFTDEGDLVGSLQPVYAGDGVAGKGGCKTGVTGCQQCPSWLELTSDGSGCYDPGRDVDCSDGYQGGCDHTCVRVNTSQDNYTRVHMTCSCREGYRLAADGRTCLFSPVCNATWRADGGCNPANIPAGGRCHTTEEGHGTCVCNPTCCRNLQVCKSEGECEPKQCVRKPEHGYSDGSRPVEHQTYPLGFRQMQHGYNGRTRRTTDAPIFQLTYSTNYSLSPLLVPDEVEVTAAVQPECHNYTGPVMHLRQKENPYGVSPDRPYIQTFTPEDMKQKDKMRDLGFRYSQEISVFSAEYQVYLRHATLTTDIKAALGRLTANSARSEFLHVMEKYGTHYISQAVFGYRREHVVYYRSLGLANWLWESFSASEGGQSFDTFLVRTLGTQDDVNPPERELPVGIRQVPDVEKDGKVEGVQTVLRSWGRCTVGGCCTVADTVMAEPALLYVSTPTPLYELLKDKETKEVFRRALLSYLWCSGEGEVVGDTCRCDIHPSYPGHTLDCAPPPKPSLYQPASDPPTDTTLTVAWQHVGREIGSHVTDYQFVVREVRSADTGLHGDDFINHPELTVSVLDDAVFSRADGCYGRGLTRQGAVWTFSLLLMCLKPDRFYRVSARVSTRDGAVSPSDVLTVRTECQTPQLNHQPTGVADALYNLYAGYTSPLAQNMAFRILTSLNTAGLHDVAKTYEEKYDNFLLRTQEELGLKRALLINASLTALSERCKTQAESGKVVQKVRRRFRCSFEGLDTRKGIREVTLREMERSCVKYEEKYDSYDWEKSMYEE
ncbi:PREDICTED: astrotactin-2-like [Branchiostoma belcheri]|uniref:Astrotactin-2-like n=1 Tax=Branchiostoma belcheri TaxID=7741 RepID=A0A6P4YHN5_BRABE|nr:PREDICTED: astrotactin-2-like [Branchiostoma belcheri]